MLHGPKKDLIGNLGDWGPLHLILLLSCQDGEPLAVQEENTINGCRKPDYKYLSQPNRSPNRVVIRNGVIGRSSHNGLHGKNGGRACAPQNKRPSIHRTAALHIPRLVVQRRLGYIWAPIPLRLLASHNTAETFGIRLDKMAPHFTPPVSLNP